MMRLNYWSIGTCLFVLLASALADPCAPLGTTGLTGRNCPASTYPAAYGSDGTRFLASVNIAYCASTDNYLFSETRYYLDGATSASDGDQFEYSIWWDQPDTHCLLDVVDFITSSFLRNSGNTDANGLINHPRLDISQYAYRKWYTRRFTIPTYTGPFAVTVSCDTPDTSIGDKKIFFKGVKLLDSAGNLKKMLADESIACGAIQPCNPTCSSNGICDVDLTCQCSPGWSDSICTTPICSAGCLNGGCTQPGQCNCQSGWQGALCDTTICTPGCDSTGGYCTAPDTCLCRQGYSGVNCNTYCTGEQPFTGAECFTINGTSQWVYNGTLVVSEPIGVDVIVLGDLVVEISLTLTDGAVISVTGCPVINGSLSLQLTPKEIEQLLATGQLIRTVLMYNTACSVSDFTSIKIINQNELKCVLVTQTPQKSPGQMTLLVSTVQSECKTDTPLSTPTNGPALPDWAIAVIVVVPVVASGIGLAVGLVRRQKQYDKALANLDLK